MKPIHFTNFTNEDFVCKYDGRPFTIKAGESKILPNELARHFAKHLVNRELHAQNKQVSSTDKHELIKKISPDLAFDEKKHFVVTIGDDEFLPSKTTMDDKIDILNEDKIDDASSEVAPPPDSPVFDPNRASRPELEAEALRLGNDAKEIEEAQNKGVLKKMIASGPVLPPEPSTEEKADDKGEESKEGSEDDNKPSEGEFQD